MASKSPAFKAFCVDLLPLGKLINVLWDRLLSTYYRNCQRVVDCNSSLYCIQSESTGEIVTNEKNILESVSGVFLESTDFDRVRGVGGRQYANYFWCINSNKTPAMILGFKQEVMGVVGRFISDDCFEKWIRIQQNEKIIGGAIASVLNSGGALTPLMRLRDYSLYSFEHSVRVSVLSVVLGDSLGFSVSEVIEIALGAMLHDVGKSMVPGNILNKPGRLTDEELVIMRKHAMDSANILKYTFGVSRMAWECASYHHERLDGSGYPYGLQAGQIPIYSQIVAVADAFDAMTSGRVYQRRMDPIDAICKLFDLADVQYSKAVLHKLVNTLGVCSILSTEKDINCCNRVACSYIK